MKSLFAIVVCLYIGTETVAAKKVELPFATTKQPEAYRPGKVLRSIELEVFCFLKIISVCKL
jgi:hypothetical protein